MTFASVPTDTRYCCTASKLHVAIKRRREALVDTPHRSFVLALWIFISIAAWHWWHRV